jgi:hypothetical protein
VLWRNPSPGVVNLELHGRRRALSRHSKGSSPGHGVEGILDEMEQHAAECTSVKGDGGAVLDAIQLEGDALGGREGLPLRGPACTVAPSSCGVVARWATRARER